MGRVDPTFSCLLSLLGLFARQNKHAQTSKNGSMASQSINQMLHGIGLMYFLSSFVISFSLAHIIEIEFKTK